MIKCERCGSSKLQKRGMRSNGKQRFHCLELECGYYFSSFPEQLNSENITKTNNAKNIIVPKIAVMDVECLPGKGYFWELFDTTIHKDQVITDTCLLSWAAKLLNSPDTYSDILTSEEALKRDAKRITLSAWEFLNGVDIVIGHNWNGFDGKVLNTNFLMYASPVYYRSIDTYQVAKSNFRFSSNSMEFINNKLGIRNKISNDGFPLWKECDNGNSEALATMLEYNIGDIFATEQLYYKVRPFIKNHPALSLYSFIDKTRCPTCLSEDLVDQSKFVFTNSSKYLSYKCNNCGAIHRDRASLTEKDERRMLLV